MNVNLFDLSQPWDGNSRPFPGQSGPVVSWECYLSSDRVNVMKIESTLHVGTHLDAPLHFNSAGKDIEGLGLAPLFGWGVVADISDKVRDYGFYTKEMILESTDVRSEDILLIHTGYYRYSVHGAVPDEERYFSSHPGPCHEFADWCNSMKFPALGVDAPAMEHPMNTRIRRLRPDLAQAAADSLGKSVEVLFPKTDTQCFHRASLASGTPHVENLGGEIGKVLGQRLVIGIFPWRFRGGEAAFCRVVGFPKELFVG